MAQDHYQEAAEKLQALTEEKFNAGFDDVWVRTTHDSGSPGRRDAFIGNGLIGLRVPVEGEPSVYPVFRGPKMAAGGTLMYGLWNADRMIEVFNFMGLQLHYGRSVFRRDSGALLDYTQTLDWRNGVVETSCTWVHRGGAVAVKYRIRLFRNLKNAGCVELELTPLNDARYTVTDIVDGGFMPVAEASRYQLAYPNDLIKTVCTRVGLRRRLLAAATHLSVDGQAAAGETVTTECGYRRSIQIPGKTGQTFRIRKIGALFGDEKCQDPIHAASSLVAGIANNFDAACAGHEQAWQTLWESRIEVSHNGLQTLLNNALYHLYSNLGEDVGWPPGPCALSGVAYCNRLFHDGEIWTFPPALLLHPELAYNYVNYRFRTYPGTVRNARANSMRGIQIAWESAEFGDEAVPGLPYSHERHINSDVSLAMWQYYLATRDRDYLRTQAAPVICGSADFWVSRAEYCAEFDRYEIRNVCCVDESAYHVDNNAVTNYSAQVNLRLAAKVCRLLDRPVNAQWQTVADKMYIPVDPERNLILEHDRYRGELINQADAVLTVYPWEMPMSDECKFNTVEYYRTRYQADKIMMGSSIDGIVDCELGRSESSWAMLLDLLAYHRGDFLLVSESPLNETINMLTGQGGLLQLVMMGWGGLRMHDDALAAANRLPRQVEHMKISNLHYSGETFDLVYRDGTVERRSR